MTHSRRQVRGAARDYSGVEAITSLAGTHEITLALQGPNGSYCVDHRTAGPPDEELLAVMAEAARRTYVRLHGEQSSEIDVMVVVLSAGERQAERELARDTVESSSAEPPDFVLEDAPGWFAGNPLDDDD
jgi:hypothetical protein